MARRATAIKGYRADNEHVLVLDAGDTLFGQPASDASDGRALTEAMSLMLYDAMTVGERDMARFPALLERSGEAKFPILSANLVYTSTGKLVFKPYVIADAGGRKVAIIGLTTADESFKALAPADVTATDPVEAARKYVAQARGEKVDAVVILSHLGNVLDRQIASEVDGITVIVGGHSFDLLPEAVQVKGTVIVQAGYNGEWLGHATIGLDADGKVASAQAEVVGLSEEYADDPELVALAAKYPNPNIQ